MAASAGGGMLRRVGEWPDNDERWERLLHLHAQGGHHEEAHIVGNRRGLRALRDAISRALGTGESECDQFTADGEGYSVFVRLDDAAPHDDDARQWALPYTQEYAAETREDAIWPWQRRSPTPPQ